MDGIRREAVRTGHRSPYRYLHLRIRGYRQRSGIKSNGPPGAQMTVPRSNSRTVYSYSMKGRRFRDSPPSRLKTQSHRGSSGRRWSKCSRSAPAFSRLAVPPEPQRPRDAPGDLEGITIRGKRLPLCDQVIFDPLNEHGLIRDRHRILPLAVWFRRTRTCRLLC